jgi:hypothetical protein
MTDTIVLYGPVVRYIIISNATCKEASRARERNRFDGLGNSDDLWLAAVSRSCPDEALCFSTMARMNRSNTTLPGYINRNGQRVVRATDLPGTDHGQRIYVLHCEHCGTDYGANGSDIFQRLCPSCQGGRPGLSIE